GVAAGAGLSGVAGGADVAGQRRLVDPRGGAGRPGRRAVLLGARVGSRSRLGAGRGDAERQPHAVRLRRGGAAVDRDLRGPPPTFIWVTSGRPLVLFVEDEPSSFEPFSAALSREGFEPVVVSTLADARAAWASRPADLVLLDLGLP